MSKLDTTARIVPTLAVRTDPHNPNHHLWLNHGTWFVHYTVYPDPLTKARVRHSLGTKDLGEARARRNRLFDRLVRPREREKQAA